MCPWRVHYYFINVVFKMPCQIVYISVDYIVHSGNIFNALT